MGDDFGVGFGAKDVSVFFEFGTELHKILYNAVMNDGKSTIAMWMRI